MVKMIGYTLVFAIPAYGVALMRYSFKYFKKRYLYKKLKAGDINLFRQEMEKSYHNLMSISHTFSAGKTDQLTEFKTELENMQRICDKIKL